MFQYIVIFSVIGLSFLWRQIVPQNIRNQCIPWAVAIAVMNVACAAFYWGLIRAVYGLSNYFIFMILIDGFAVGDRAKNSVWKMFMIFWAYMILSTSWGLYVFNGYAYWIQVLIISFFPGYYAARCVIKDRSSIRRLSIAFATISIITMFVYYKHGGLSVIEAGSAVGRAGFDVDTLNVEMKSNVNYTALCMVCFIPFLVLSLLRNIQTKKDKKVSIASSIALILILLSLIRTGARNGVFALLPTMWYALFSSTNYVTRRKRIILFVCLTIIFVPLMLFMMNGAEYIRAFDISGAGRVTGERSLNAFSSGRVEMWGSVIDTMTDIQKVFGAGLMEWARNPETGKIASANAHSMFMTIFYQSGFFGIALFVLVNIMVLKRGLHSGEPGKVALMFWGTWLFSGLGESWGITGGMTGLLAGFGIGLLTEGASRNPELGDCMGYPLDFYRYSIRGNLI